jgi:EmrB/QacA subfamily drug resistance transporter
MTQLAPSRTRIAPSTPVVTTSTSGSRWPALIVLCAGMLMIVLDQTIVNVALPTIQRDLGFSQSSLAWVVNAYLIAFGGLLLLAGRLGDLIGRKRVYLAGLTLFTGASLVCGASGSQAMLIAARFVQGVGGAISNAAILGVIVTMFPEPREQAKAIGVYTFIASAGGTIGLLAGGVITQTIGWHWIFFINLPIGIAAAGLAGRLLESDHGIGLRAGADGPGAVLVTAALMLGVYTIVAVPDYGWVSLHTVGLGAATALLFAAFIARQATAYHPLLPLRVFRSRHIAGANLTTAMMVAGLFGFFFLGTLYLQRVLGYGPLGIGLAFLPVALAIGVLGLGFSARLNTRLGARTVLLPGLALCVAGLALLSRAPVHGRYLVDVFPAMLLLGIGAGLSFPTLTIVAMSGATPSDSGLASGLINTTAQFGGAFGLAVLATLSTSRTTGLLGRGENTAAALTAGYHLAFGIGAGLIVAAAVVATLMLRPAVRDADGPRGVVAERRRPSMLIIATALLGVYVLFGSSFTAVKIALAVLPPFLMLGVRFLVAGGLLYAWASWRRGQADDPPGLLHWKNAFLIGGSIIAGGIGGVAFAEQFLPSGLTALLVSSSPVWAVLINYAFFREEITWPTAAGLALGLGGLVMLVRPAGQGHLNALGAAAAVVAGVLWAIGSVFAPRMALPRSPLASAAMQMLAAGALLLAAAFATGELFRLHWAWDAGLAVLYLIVVSSLIGFVAYTWLLTTVPVTVSSTVAFGTPVAAVLIGWGALGEQMTPSTLLATGTIILGMALMSAGRKKPGVQPSGDPARRSSHAVGALTLDSACRDCS